MPNMPYCDPADAQCGGALTNASGVITSPGYPGPYQHNAQCVWTITVPASSSIALTFTVMDLEGHSACLYDYVEVINRNNKKKQGVEKFWCKNFAT